MIAQRFKDKALEFLRMFVIIYFSPLLYFPRLTIRKGKRKIGTNSKQGWSEDKYIYTGCKRYFGSISGSKNSIRFTTATRDRLPWP